MKGRLSAYDIAAQKRKQARSTGCLRREIITDESLRKWKGPGRDEREKIMKLRTLILFCFLLVCCFSCAEADNLYIPASTLVIDEEAFAGDQSVTRLILPRGLREIGREAFRGCGLEMVWLPDGLEVLGEGAFDSSTAVWISPGSPVKALLEVQGLPYTEMLLPESITLSLDPETVTLSATGEILPGEKAALRFTVSPEGADTSHLVWSSSDPEVAAVSGDGTVEGLKSGTAVIRLETAAGVYGEIEVTVHTPVCRALIVANVHYYNKYVRWNEGDVGLMQAMLGTVNSSCGEPWQVSVAYDQDETKLEGTLRDAFADTCEGDISILHISTHGYNEFSRGNYAGVGIRMSNGRKMTYIPYSLLKTWMDQYIKGDVIVILEACYAAAAFNEKCGSPLCGDRTYILASCGYREHCYSHSEKFNYFVEWLVEGVKDMKADTNGDGALSLSELNGYIYNKGCTTNVRSAQYRYFQHAECWPADSDYILFTAR